MIFFSDFYILFFVGNSFNLSKSGEALKDLFSNIENKLLKLYLKVKNMD